MTQRRRSYLNRQKRFWLMLEILLGAAFLVMVAIIAMRALGQADIAREETEARQMAEVMTDAGQQEVFSEQTESVSGVVEPKMLEYFEPLAEINNDIAGLVEFGQDMALYVAQGSDNEYYMTHKLDRSETPAGMIYLDYACSIYPASDNLILYGHNMGDGSRFGTLKRFESLKHLREYPVIRFTTLYEPANYVIVAVYHTSMTPTDAHYIDYREIDFETTYDFEQYLTMARDASIYDIPVDVRSEDQLLTMLTCSNEVEDRGRLVVLCRKQRDGETVQNVRDWMAQAREKEPVYPSQKNLSA